MTTPDQNSEERIRKVFVKDLKAHDALHSVFKAGKKERLTSRGGAPYLAITLVDRTGEVDARVFENVDAAQAAFEVGDYLLIKGKVGHFHGKPQIVIEAIERLDPEPIDPKDFEYVAPPPKEAKEPKTEPRHEEGAVGGGHKAARQRLLKLLDNPEVASALDVLVRHFEKMVDERVERRLSGAPAKPERTERPDRPERKRDRGPRVEHKAKGDEVKATASDKPAPQRDPSLPEGLAFKPFSQLVETPAEAPAAPAQES